VEDCEVIFLLVLLLLLPTYAGAAITFDTASGSGGLSSTSHSHTVAADANIAIICTAQRETGLAVAQSTSVTIGGQAADGMLVGVNNSTNNVRAELWYKLSPLTGAQTVAVTGGAGTDRMVTTVMTWKNVAQTSTFNTAASIGSTASGTNADLNGIASAVGEMAVLCGSVRVLTATPSPDATAPVSTERIEQGFDSGGTTHMGFGYSEDGAASTVDMRIDLAGSETWALVAASMREVAASSTSGYLKRRTP
jgi:hypothetical protein